MLNNTQEKKRKLIEEKNTMSLNSTTVTGVARHLRSRKLKDIKEPIQFKRRLNPPHINYTLKDSEIIEDINLIQKSISLHPSFGKWGRKSTEEVYTDRGKLYYHNQIFEKGKDVFVEAKNESGKWHGTIVAVNPAEIHIKSPDGTKSRFLLTHLRNGKYNITLIN